HLLAENSPAPGLDWVEHIFPHFADVCRDTVRAQQPAGIQEWMDWLNAEDGSVQKLRHAGREVYPWRRQWMLVLLQASQRAIQALPGGDTARAEAANGLEQEYGPLPVQLAISWRALLGF